MFRKILINVGMWKSENYLEKPVSLSSMKVSRLELRLSGCEVSVLYPLSHVFSRVFVFLLDLFFKSFVHMCNRLGLLSLLLTSLSYLPYIPTSPPSSLKSTVPHCIHSFLCLALGPHPPSLTGAVYVTNFFSLESLRSQKFSRGRWGPLSFSPTHGELLPGFNLV